MWANGCDISLSAAQDMETRQITGWSFLFPFIIGSYTSFIGRITRLSFHIPLQNVPMIQVLTSPIMSVSYKNHYRGSHLRELQAWLFSQHGNYENVCAWTCMLEHCLASWLYACIKILHKVEEFALRICTAALCLRFRTGWKFQPLKAKCINGTDNGLTTMGQC